ncbi:MAG: hypothetical protein BWY31_04717 [Lentisphaerae bacterium ADurb.Bin242]|nr:MAG: hypothetical protein BWY31_04717 [Lentisphaerae bacterium ADurb.Bin242]
MDPEDLAADAEGSDPVLMRSGRARDQRDFPVSAFLGQIGDQVIYAACTLPADAIRGRLQPGIGVDIDQAAGQSAYGRLFLRPRIDEDACVSRSVLELRENVAGVQHLDLSREGIDDSALDFAGDEPVEGIGFRQVAARGNVDIQDRERGLVQKEQCFLSAFPHEGPASDFALHDPLVRKGSHCLRDRHGTDVEHIHQLALRIETLSGGIFVSDQFDQYIPKLKPFGDSVFPVQCFDHRIEYLIISNHSALFFQYTIIIRSRRFVKSPLMEIPKKVGEKVMRQ